MRKILYFLLLFVLLLMTSCKKDVVDGSSVKTFQESINEMTISLSTLQQTKFNEALYILKTFAVEGESDMQRLEVLAKLIDAKKVSEIFSLADEVAAKNDVDWSSAAPPSLGETNIFQNIIAQETDPNDISASALDIVVQPIEVDSLVGVKVMKVIPRLVDRGGKVVKFSNASLEAVMEVYSNGVKLFMTKNLMTNNEFKGFYLRMASLPVAQVVDKMIDIKVSVKTTRKTYQLLKVGISVSESTSQPIKAKFPQNEENNTLNVTDMEGSKRPDGVVSRFLNHLNSHNFRAAYEASENPNWGSYDRFADPSSGFGGVKNIIVENISTRSVSDKDASVNAVYRVIDTEGKVIELDVSYSLKKIENVWKITNYEINSSEKQ